MAAHLSPDAPILEPRSIDRFDARVISNRGPLSSWPASSGTRSNAHATMHADHAGATPGLRAPPAHWPL